MSSGSSPLAAIVDIDDYEFHPTNKGDYQCFSFAESHSILIKIEENWDGNFLPYYYNITTEDCGKFIQWIGWYSEVKGSNDIRTVMQASIQEIQDYINESQDYL